VYGQPVAAPMGQPQLVAVVIPHPPPVEINIMWVNQQVESSSCYIKILASLLLAYSLYGLITAAVSASVYSPAWDILSSVILLIISLIGLASGITNKTSTTKIYYYVLLAYTVFIIIGLIIVLSVIGANPCKDVDANGHAEDKNKLCDYSVATIRAILVILALIVMACCGCCAYCAKMHLTNLQMRDTALSGQPAGRQQMVGTAF